jgi:hypothetical protein
LTDITTFYTSPHAKSRNIVSNEKSGQQTREDFYRSSQVMNHIRRAGIPTTTGAFRDMVASSSKLNLSSPEGLNLIEVLGNVTFSKHPQQINIMDKSSGKMMVSIST